VNKALKVASKSLKSLLVDFYSPEDLCQAREVLLNEVTALQIADTPKLPKRRHLSNGRPLGLPNLEDILTLLTFLDERQLLARLSLFVSSDPDRLPCIRLVEGDLAILWTKLDFISELLSSLKSSIDVNNHSISVQSNAIQSVQAAIEELRSGKGKVTASQQPNLHSAARPIRNLQARRQATASQDNLSGDSIHGARQSSAGSLAPVSAQPELRAGHSRDPSRWSSIMSDSAGGADSDSDRPIDRRPFTDVTSRSAKRKDRSPLQQGVNVLVSPPNDGPNIKKINLGGPTLMNYRDVLVESSAVIKPSTSMRAAVSGVVRPARIMGKSNRVSVLKAGIKLNPVEKETFCVSNVGSEYSVNDIRKHCADLGVRVLFAFDITNDSARTKSFKLAVPMSDSDVIMDAESWPSRVLVRRWRLPRGDPVRVRREVGVGIRGEGDLESQPRGQRGNSAGGNQGGDADQGSSSMDEGLHESRPMEQGGREVSAREDQGNGLHNVVGENGLQPAKPPSVQSGVEQEAGSSLTQILAVGASNQSDANSVIGAPAAAASDSESLDLTAGARVVNN